MVVLMRLIRVVSLSPFIWVLWGSVVLPLPLEICEYGSINNFTPLHACLCRKGRTGSEPRAKRMNADVSVFSDWSGPFGNPG